MMASITGALCFILLVFINDAAGNPYERDVKPRPVCRTEACVNRGNYILNLMDPRVNPCEDFYKFACGNFLRIVEIPEDESSVHSFKWIAEYSKSRLVGLMSAEPRSDEPRAYKRVKLLYKLCMDEEALNKRGVEPLLEKLKVAGGWPVLGDWDRENWNPWDTQDRLRELGLIAEGSFFEMSFYPINKTSLTIILRDMKWGQEFLKHGEGNPEVQSLLEYMVEIAVLLGADRETAELQLAEVLYFQMKLAELKDNDYNPITYTLKNFTEEFDWMDWGKLINSTLGKRGGVNDDQEIEISNFEYFKRLGDFIKNYSSEVVANYVIWGAVSNMADRLTSDLRGLKERKPRSEECTDILESSFALVLSSMFVSSSGYNETKSIVEKMAERLRQEMLRDIMEVDWLDDDSRLHAEDKIIRMGKNIAFPRELVQSDKLDSFYDKLEMNQENFFEALLDVDKWRAELGFTLPQEVKDSDWKVMGESVRDINAFNMPNLNKIEIPAGILHNPFFDAGVPDYANYATIGMIVGHEIVHSFDNNGVFYDWGGNMSGVSEGWWKNETMETFNAKKQCIIDQYSNFTDKRTQLSLDGENTQGENIADNGGFKLAYRAYHRLRGTKEPEPALPGLQHFTVDQLFMLSYANAWCIKHKDSEMEMNIRYDPHSPGEFRANGVLSNSPEFSRAFRCAPGDRMNPVHKCAVW